MQITLQLTEVPANEKVSNRVFTLPEIGGNFGSDFDCDIQLPDRSGQVAAKHGCFTPTNNRMTVQAFAGNNIALQGQVLAPGKRAVIEDGTIISVGDYVMLVSMVGNLEGVSDTTDTAPAQTQSFGHYFSQDGLLDDDEDDFTMKSDSAETTKEQTMAQDQTPHFASSGVFSDDPFEDDPFDDQEISLNVDDNVIPESKGFKDQEEDDKVETIVAEEEDEEFILMDKALVKTPGNDNVPSQASEQQITQLVSLLENQLTSNNALQNKIFQAIDATLTSFVNEFSPSHLEDVFDDFTVPFFVQKEKQYWRSYRKSFKRRLDSGEYHRLFKALLLANMQNGDAEDKGDNKK